MSVVNEGEKVSMRGALKVVDVTDGPVDDETIFLHPSDIQVSQMEEVAVKESVQDDILEDVEEAPTEIIVQKQKTFIEKLEESDFQLMNTDATEIDGSISEAVVPPPAPQGSRAPISLTTCVIIAVIIYGLSFVSIATTKLTTYTPTGNENMSEKYHSKYHLQKHLKLFQAKYRYLGLTRCLGILVLHKSLNKY